MMKVEEGVKARKQALQEWFLGLKRTEGKIDASEGGKTG